LQLSIDAAVQGDINKPVVVSSQVLDGLKKRIAEQERPSPKHSLPR